MLNICLVCDEYPPAPHGGNGSLYSDLALGLARTGHRVSVVGVYAKDTLAKLSGPDRGEDNLAIVRLPQSPGFLRYRGQALWDRWRLLRWLQREHQRAPFDIIESADYAGWLNRGGPRGAATVIRMGGSNLFFDHELQRRGDAFQHELERRCVRHATVLGAVSHYAARRTLELCGQPSRPVTVIHNAVDTELFSPSATTAEPGLVVFVNSLNPKKGIEQLLDAMNLVCAKFPAARLAVVGQDTQPAENGRSYVDRLRGRIRPEFRARVEFTGRLDRRTGVVNYLRRASVCCLPSHMETFGIAAAEAMAVGKPTIYSRTGPGPEVVEDGVSGLLCNPLDAGDIADKILRLLQDASLAARLGQGARARVLAMFNKADWIARNLDFYRQCVEKH